MAPTRFNSRDLTAEHVGRIVSVTWPTADTRATHSVTGELESISQYRQYARGEVMVGDHRLSIEFQGPVQLFLHDEE